MELVGVADDYISDNIEREISSIDTSIIADQIAELPTVEDDDISSDIEGAISRNNTTIITHIITEPLTVENNHIYGSTDSEDTFMFGFDIHSINTLKEEHFNNTKSKINEVYNAICKWGYSLNILETYDTLANKEINFQKYWLQLKKIKHDILYTKLLIERLDKYKEYELEVNDNDFVVMWHKLYRESIKLENRLLDLKVRVVAERTRQKNISTKINQ